MKSEAEVLQDIRLGLSVTGVRAFRNNVGVAVDRTGRSVRYGIANESRNMNSKIKSSDLICIAPVIITLDMVGMKIGRFMAIEVKREGWRYTGTGREPAQLAWLDLINSLGGDGRFATCMEDLR